MLRLLKPIAYLLLRRGVTAHEFSRWADAAFVSAAVKQLKEQGIDPSFSRVSALTGIHRHAVSGILNSLSSEGATTDDSKDYEKNRLARVLAGWFEDPSFTSDEGRPRILALDGVPYSFSELVRKYSGDIYPGIILDELERVGAVKRVQGTMVEVVSRRYTRGGADEEFLRHADYAATDVLRTIEHNTRAAPSERYYEDAAIAADLPADVIPRLARLLERRAASFLNDLDGWLTSNEPAIGEEHNGEHRVRAGVRVVMVVEPDPDVVDEKKPR